MAGHRRVEGHRRRVLGAGDPGRRAHRRRRGHLGAGRHRPAHGDSRIRTRHRPRRRCRGAAARRVSRGRRRTFSPASTQTVRNPSWSGSGGQHDGRHHPVVCRRRHRAPAHPGAIRQGDRHLPGPAAQRGDAVGQQRVGHRGGLGCGARRGRTARPAPARRGRGGDHRDLAGAGPGARRPDDARRHRFHLGTRRAPVLAAGHQPGGIDRSGQSLGPAAGTTGLRHAARHVGQSG